jgi:hypothetical protein
MKSIINTMPLGTAFQKPAKASPDQLLAFIRNIAFGSQTPAACWFQLRLLASQKPAKASPDQLLAFIRHIAFGSQTPAACWFQLRLLASRSQLQAETNRLLFMMINLC